MSLLALVIALFASFQIPVFKEHVQVNAHVDVCASGSCVDGGGGSVH